MEEWEGRGEGGGEGGGERSEVGRRWKNGTEGVREGVRGVKWGGGGIMGGKGWGREEVREGGGEGRRG